MSDSIQGRLDLARWHSHVVIGLLAIQAVLLAWSAAVHSPTIDEPAHLVAGVLAWESGRFDFYRVNPPLVRMIGAMPVVLSAPETSWGLVGRDLPGERFEWSEGSHFLRRNAPLSHWYLVWARWAVIPLVAVGGYVCYQWAKELYGTPAGLVALTLWCFCPNILGHGALMTSDAGAAAMGVLAAYAFWRWLEIPSRRHLSWAGATLGAALLTKLTWAILLPLWIVIGIANEIAYRRSCPTREPKGSLGRLGGVLLILGTGVVVLNVGYGFSHTLQRLDEFRFVSESFGNAGNVARLHNRPESTSFQFAAGNRFASSWVGAVRIPLPRDYLIGLDQQRFDFESAGLTSYLRGRHRHGGWWYWYAYALAIKVPVGMWCLGALALFWIRRRSGGAGWRGDVLVLLPAMAVVALASSQTGFTNHLRYILPAFPFAFVWMSQTVSTARGPIERATVATAIGWTVLSSLSVYPHSLSYFNEVIGGPKHGARHLLDSNVDWGQDLYLLKAWTQQHPEAHPLYVECFSAIPPLEIGVDAFPPLPGPTIEGRVHSQETHLGSNWPQTGWHAISMSRLFSQAGEFAAFHNLTPIDRIGYSINVYRISDDDSRRMRREYGLHERATEKETIHHASSNK
ncbi:MAG: glycosyltransferase family 39 protein [Planctomycetota bacterium]